MLLKIEACRFSDRLLVPTDMCAAWITEKIPLLQTGHLEIGCRIASGELMMDCADAWLGGQLTPNTLIHTKAAGNFRPYSLPESDVIRHRDYLIPGVCLALR